MRPWFAAALMIAAPAPAATASAAPKDEVLAATNAFIAALNRGDAATIEAMTHPSMATQMITFPPEGGTLFRLRPRQQLLDTLRTAPPRKFEERLVKTKVLITRDYAHVWAPYTLDINDQRIHCGVDSFGWAKLDGKWMLVTFGWTGDPKGCPPR